MQPFGHCEKFALIEVQAGPRRQGEPPPPPPREPGGLPRWLGDPGAILSSRAVGTRGHDPVCRTGHQGHYRCPQPGAGDFRAKLSGRVPGPWGQWLRPLSSLTGRWWLHPPDITFPPGGRPVIGSFYSAKMILLPQPSRLGESLFSGGGRRLKSYDKNCVSARGPDLSGQVNPRFGRAPYFFLINPDTREFEAAQQYLHGKLSPAQGPNVSGHWSLRC